MSNQPYIGLRPFERFETDIFFGRETHSDELINRLGSNHFLAVIGTSGGGKSSLVKTGLIAGLEAGYLAKAGTHWQIVEMRPGQQPFYALSEKLLAELKAVLPANETVESLADKLRQGSLSLHELLAQHPLPNNAQLLIVCDQFEEIFRYFQHGEAAEARNFVSLLLASSKPYPLSSGVVSHSLYVVITMRSDFLGDCAQFAGLAEAINQGLYLTPRLDAQQLRAAIEEPAFVFGGEVEPALVTQLLEDAGNNPDQLPLLQHALMIMWQLSEKDGTSVLTLKHYEQVGGLKNALSNHADRKFENLSPSQQRIAEIMFRALTERADAQRDTRRPLPLAEIVALTGANFAEVVTVIDEFRQTGRCFLMPPMNVVLNNDSVIDISHESFIRQWQMLKDWAADEADSAKMYQRLEDKVMQWQNHKGSLLHSPELEIYQQWWQEKNLNDLWLKRYGDVSYQKLSIFIEQSLAQKQAETAEKERLLHIVERQKNLAMEVINQFTYDIPEKLANIPQTGRLTADILEFNSQKLEEIYALNPDDKSAQRERYSNFIFIGDLYLNLLGDVDKALQYFQDGLKIAEQIATQDPNNSLAQRDLSVSLGRLGDIHLQLNQTDKALSFYNQSLKIREQIATQDPNNSAAQQDLAFSYEKMGDVNLALNKTKEAIDFYSKEFDILKKLADDDKSNIAAQRAFSVSLNKLGNIHLQLNQTDKALSFYNQALKIREQIAKQDPNNSAAQRDLLVSFCKLGELEKQRKNKAAAKAWFKKALPIAQKLAEDKMNAKAQEDLEELLNTMKGL
jgi:tetratricopeptide (TPR) repeat protein